jgi:hypothetical protein
MAVKGKELKTKKTDIPSFTFDGEEYQVTFDFNVLCEIENVYPNEDVFQALEDLQKPKISAVRAALYAMVKVENEKVTLKDVGKKLDLETLVGMKEKMDIALSNDMPEQEENTGE